MVVAKRRQPQCGGDLDVKTCPNPGCPDRRLTGVAGEYRDGVERCPRCDGRLVHRRRDAAGRRGDADESAELVLVAEVSNPAVLVVVKSLLDSAGIRWFTRNEETQNLIGGGQAGAGFNLAIGGVEADAASSVREVLAGCGEADEGSPPSEDTPVS